MTPSRPVDANSRVAIVGASLGGLATAAGLRERGYEGEVVVVEGERLLPPNRPPLSKEVLTGERTLDESPQPEAANLEALRLDLRLGVRATALDVEQRVLTTEDGATIDSDAVVLAAGSEPRRPPIPGASRPGVHVLRTAADAMGLRAELAEGPARVLVVGAGFIGLEVASSARSLGIEVTVVEAFATPASRVLPAEAGAALAKVALAAGVDLRTELSVTELLGATGSAGAAEDAPVAAARLSDGSTVEASVVLLAVGAAPVTDWLANTPGLTVDDGVVADATCLAAPGVAVVGDVARWWHEGYREHIRVEHWDNAIEMGRYVAGRLLSGDDVAPYTPVPWFWSHQFGAKFQLTGRVRPGDRLAFVDGTPDDAAWVAVSHDGNRVFAALGMNRNPKVMRLRMRMDSPGGLSLAEAVDG
ncbi:MAG: FAD-dependent oxidoreductase [Microthrixaceae bacterium]